jgi:hypothetical protein
VSGSDDGGWRLAALEGEDGDFMLRSRVRLPDPAERARLPVAVWVSWDWGDIASEAEQDAVLEDMIAFENAAYSDAEPNGWARLMAVRTSGEGREWLWYAASGDAFVADLRSALAGCPTYPFEVRAWDDPQWNAARDLDPRGFMH